jgi:hypothetical protein
VVQQNAMQNAKTVALCLTHQWGMVCRNALFCRLKNFLALARRVHYIEVRKKEVSNEDW